MTLGEVADLTGLGWDAVKAISRRFMAKGYVKPCDVNSAIPSRPKEASV